MRRAFLARPIIGFCVAFAAAGPALAQICHPYAPIRATGAACSRAGAIAHIRNPNSGEMVCCVPAPGSAPSYRGPVNDRYATGLRAAGTMLGIVAELLSMIDSSPEVDYDAEARARAVERERERAAAQQRLDAQRLDAARRAEAWNELGLRQARIGDYTSAVQHLKAAVRYAIEGGDDAGEKLYERNLSVIEAYLLLREALAFKAEGQIQAANRRFMLAEHRAWQAGRADLRDRISGYRLSMVASNPRARLPAKKKTSCVSANGQLLCD